MWESCDKNHGPDNFSMIFRFVTMENTTSVDVSTVFSKLATISVDYELFTYFDAGLMTFQRVSATFSVLGSLICILLNCRLLQCILTVSELKNLMFFPIGLQAGMSKIYGQLNCNEYGVRTFHPMTFQPMQFQTLHFNLLQFQPVVFSTFSKFDLIKF